MSFAAACSSSLSFSAIVPLSIDDTDTFFSAVPIFSPKALALISRDTWSADGMAAMTRSSLVYASLVARSCSVLRNAPMMLFWESETNLKIILRIRFIQFSMTHPNRPEEDELGVPIREVQLHGPLQAA